MLDLAGVVTLLRWAVFGTLGLSLLLAILLNKTAKARIGWSLGVLAIFASFVGFVDLKLWLSRQQAMEEARKNGLPATPEEYRARYETAKTLFDERCKSAGEKIYKSVDDIEGVLLLSVRPGIADRIANEANPDWPDAGLPQQYGGEDYIRSFVAWEHRQNPTRRGILHNQKRAQSGGDYLPGYSYVDVKEDDGAIYRYRLVKSADSNLSLDKERLSGEASRYAISYRNLIDPKDRAYWIAGTTVVITDTKTKELVAEKTWYSFEPGMGSRAGQRQPWRFAISCPALVEGESMRYPTRMFVDQVLKPSKAGTK